MRKFEIVVAADLKGGIGKAGTLPWKISGDMANFKHLTSDVEQEGKLNAVIMGRKTWDSIPAKFRPLKGRLNIVLTGNRLLSVDDGVLVAGSLDNALELCDSENIENVFVIGGAAVYGEALKHPNCRLLHLTRVHSIFDCDTFLADFSVRFEHQSDLDRVQQEDGIRYVFQQYVCKLPGHVVAR